MSERFSISYHCPRCEVPYRLELDDKGVAEHFGDTFTMFSRSVFYLLNMGGELFGPIAPDKQTGLYNAVICPECLAEINTHEKALDQAKQGAMRRFIQFKPRKDGDGA